MVRIVYHNKKIEQAERSLDACWVTKHTCAGGGSPTGGRPEGQAAGDRRCRPSSPRGWHRPRGARLRGLTDAGSLVHRGPHGERLPGARAHPSVGPCAQPPAPEERAPQSVRRQRWAWLTQPGLPPRPDPDGGTGSQDRRRWEGRPAAPPAHGQGSPAARPQPSAPPPATHACSLCCPVTCPALAHTARGTRPGGPAATCAGDRGQRQAGCRPHGPRPPRGPLPSGGRRIIRSCRELPRSTASDKALTMPAAARTAASTGRTRPRCAGREPAAAASPSL